MAKNLNLKEAALLLCYIAWINFTYCLLYFNICGLLSSAQLTLFSVYPQSNITTNY